MKNTFKAALAATLIIGTASAARADLTEDGSVGLIFNPTAQKPDASSGRLEGTYARLNEPGGGDSDYFGLTAAGGLGDNAELSGGVQHIRNGGDDTGFALGAKYVFKPRTSGVTGARSVNFAAGGGYSKLRLKNLYGYLVATAALGAITEGTQGREPITGSLGVRFNKYDDVFGDDSQAQIYGGVDVPFTRTGDWSGVAELASEPINGGDVQYALGLRYRPAGQSWSAGVGIIRSGFGDDTGFFAKIGYNFANLGAR